MAAANVTGGSVFQQAAASGDIGIGLGGAGFLLVYYLGVLGVLEEVGAITRGRCRA